MDMERTVKRIKQRLQMQQKRLGEQHEGDVDTMVNLMVRAEHDALWAALEAMAQSIDGKKSVEVRDYFGDRHS